MPGFIPTWIDTGALPAVGRCILIFMVWTITQYYAYFEVQTGALSNAPREERFKTAAQTLRTVFVEGLLPRD